MLSEVFPVAGFAGFSFFVTEVRFVVFFALFDVAAPTGELATDAAITITSTRSLCRRFEQLGFGFAASRDFALSNMLRP